MLFSTFSKQEILPAEFPLDLATYSIDALNEYSIFYGHLDWACLDCLTGNKFTFTMLRNPRDRIISNYFYWKNLANQNSREDLIRSNLPHIADLKDYDSLTQYFLSEKETTRTAINITFNNMYAYYFATRRYGWPFFNPMMRADQVLSNAICNIEKLSFVGITEYMDLSIAWLRSALVIPQTTPTLNANNTHALDGEREAIEREIRMCKELESTFEAFTALDNIVYKKMRERFLQITRDSRYDELSASSRCDN
jgi:hypothetical protein